MYPPETKIAVVMEGYNDGQFYNNERNITESDKTLEDAWATTLADPKIKFWGGHVIAVIFTETPPDPNAPPPPKPRTPIARCLRPTVIELLKAAPLNEIARGHAMNDLKKAIPDECQTFEQITEWVETNCAPMLPARGSIHIAAGRVRNREAAFEIEVTESATETGRCRYSRNLSGIGDVPLRVDDVLEIVDEAIADENGMERVLNELSDRINEMASDYADMSGDDYEYEDYEALDSDDHETEFDRRQLTSRLREWLADNHPEKLQELENNT